MGTKKQVFNRYVMIAFVDLMEAYLCRRHKRYSAAALAFEVNLEDNLMALYWDIVENRYSISSSIAFVVEKPVCREVFAADFRDRIVHHLLMQLLIPSLGVRYYGRYVDDFVIVHKEREYLKDTVFKIERFLADELQLTLHPKKRFLQHYKKGVVFLGVKVRGGAVLTGKRTKSAAYGMIHRYADLSKMRLLTPQEMKVFRDSINSYWGLMRH